MDFEFWNGVNNEKRDSLPMSDKTDCIDEVMTRLSIVLRIDLDNARKISSKAFMEMSSNMSSRDSQLWMIPQLIAKTDDDASGAHQHLFSPQAARYSYWVYVAGSMLQYIYLDASSRRNDDNFDEWISGVRVGVSKYLEQLQVLLGRDGGEGINVSLLKSILKKPNWTLEDMCDVSKLFPIPVLYDEEDEILNVTYAA
jgi:hypothetical protein